MSQRGTGPTDAERQQMRQLVQEGVPVVEVARTFDCSKSLVFRVARGIKRKRRHPRPVREEERQRIRALYQEGFTFAEIGRIVGRGESTVERSTRGLKRKKPQPRNRKAQRNDEILRLVEQGLSRARVGRRFGISARQVSTVVAEHPVVVALLQEERAKPAAIARRFRMELSTARRIATGKSAKEIPRSWDQELRNE